VTRLARALLDELDPDDLAELAEKLLPYLPGSTTDSGWMNSRAAADYLGMPISTLHRLVAAKEIPYSQDGPRARCFFRRSDLNRWREATAS
jgi:excisionase family DNA binding protein